MLVDDFSAGEPAPCRSSTPIRTVALDADTAKPDVTVTLSADAAALRLQDLRPFGAVLAAGRRRPPRRDVEDRPAARSHRFHPLALTDRVSAASTMPAVRRPGERGIARFPGSKSPRIHSTDRVAAGLASSAEPVGTRGRRSMQVRPVTNTPRKTLSSGASAAAGDAALDVHRHRRRDGRRGPVHPSLSRQRDDLRSVAVRDRHRRPVLRALRRDAHGDCRATAGCTWSCVSRRSAARNWPTAPGS